MHLVNYMKAHQANESLDIRIYGVFVYLCPRSSKRESVKFEK